jgi:aspartate/methionine/tyrosine aminotransferase
MWIDESDVILLPDKIWGNYTLIVTVLHGAQIKQYGLFSSQGEFNLSGFEDTLQEEAKRREKIVVLLNFPNNPTGYTPTKEEGKRIVEILLNLAEKGTNVLVLLDDAYFGLFYDDNSMKESLFALLT